MNKKDLIDRFKSIHGDKFDYSDIDDNVKRRDKIKVKCPTHGDFFQYVGNHLQGRGCRECENDSRRKSIDKVKSDFSEIHNGKYIYNIKNYINNKQKIDIECPIHGTFSQRIDSHLRGIGCPECGGSRKLKSEEFINRSNKIHSDYYKYNDVVYKNVETPVKIKCPIHGDFNMTPHSHLKGSGCPKCSMSLGERKISNFLNENSIYLLPQHIFKDCKYLKYLIFDFWIPDLKICIEFDGKQHYEPIAYFGGEDKFKISKIKDDIKDKYCLDNNIKLIRISHKYFSNIENILKKELLS